MNHLDLDREDSMIFPPLASISMYLRNFPSLPSAVVIGAAPNFVSWDASGVHDGRPHRTTPASPLTEHSDIQFSSDPKSSGQGGPAVSLCANGSELQRPPPRFCASTRHFAWSMFGSTYLVWLWGLSGTPLMADCLLFDSPVMPVYRIPLVRHKRTGNR